MSDEVVTFYPPKRPGLIFHGAVITAMTGAGALGIWQASLAEIGPVFLAFLLPASLLLGGAAFLVYRAYALLRASYAIERDGIHLRWGLRTEDIPMDVVYWVGMSEQAKAPPALPVLRWPGAVLGIRRSAGGRLVEFLAARNRGIILIVAAQRTFAITPADPIAFLRTFQRLTELGSLTPVMARSLHPTYLLSSYWANLPARVLLLVGGLLSFGLLIWVSLAVPELGPISLRFNPDGSPQELFPAVRLLLLPVLNLLIFLADLLLGLFFYRRPESQVLAFLIWGNGVLTAIGFAIAVFSILQAS